MNESELKIAELEKQLATFKKMNDTTSYIEEKQKQEKSWFKLLNPACFVTVTDGEIQYKTSADASHNLEHVRVTVMNQGKVKEYGFFDLWRKDPSIRIYNKVVFKPSPLQALPDEFNSFQGFPTLQGNLIPIPEFHELVDSLSGYDEKCSTYLKSYLADIIQNPAGQNRSHSRCIILRGEQGGGKTSMEILLRKLIGKKYVNRTADINSVLKSKDNRFAMGAVNKLVVVLEEMTSEDGNSKADLLKDVITADKIQQEIKNINGEIEHVNYCRFFVFTNHAKSIKIESSDRRYIIFRSSSKNIGNKQFWDNIYTKMEDDNWLYSVYHYLSTLDIKTFDFSNRPITAAYERNKAHSIPYTVRYLADLLSSEKKEETKYTIDELWASFDEFVKSNKFKHEMSKPSFKCSLDELVEDNAGLHKKKISLMKYFIVGHEFKEYCAIKKYNLFEEEVKETEKQNPQCITNDFDNGVIQTEMKIDPVPLLQKKNEELTNENQELKRLLEEYTLTAKLNQIIEDYEETKNILAKTDKEYGRVKKPVDRTIVVPGKKKKTPEIKKKETPEIKKKKTPEIETVLSLFE